MRAQQLTGFRVEHGFHHTLGLAQSNCLAIADEGETAHFHGIACFFGLGFGQAHAVLADGNSILDPQASLRAPTAAAPKAVRKAREVKIYKNPNSGERIETKGGNHRQLKEWKNEFGADVVESWRTQ